MPERDGALADLRVLDLTRGPAGLCTRLLADLGADVVKVEPPAGDPCRRWPPFLEDTPHPDRSLFFWTYNLNKRSITLDITKEEGRGLFLRLVERADAVVEDFTPGSLEGLGLGYEALRQRNPRLVLASATTFGQWGPRARWKGGELVAQAAGGMMAVCGDPDREPVKAVGFQAHNVASVYAATALLMAVHYADITGQGQQVDVSMQEAVASVLEVANIFYIYQGLVTRRQGTRHGLHGPGTVGDVYACKDGYVCLIAPEPKQMMALYLWMDEEGRAGDLLTDNKFVEGGLQRPHDVEEHIHALVSAFFADKTKQELLEEGQRRGVTIAPVSNLEEVEANPQLAFRRFWVQVEHPELGRHFTYPGPFAQLSLTPWRVYRRPPLLGEHTREVLCGELGLAPEELGLLASAGVV